jgi:hypothetical protein
MKYIVLADKTTEPMCVEKNQLESESVFRFFPARQAPEIILNEYSNNTENALFKWLGKETTRYFTKSKFFGFKSSFHNCFWNGLSEICKIRNVWKLPSPFSRNTLIPCSEKTS